MRHCVGVAKTVSHSGLELLCVQLRVRRVDLAVGDYAVVLAQEAELDAARAGVDDKNAYRPYRIVGW